MVKARNQGHTSQKTSRCGSCHHSVFKNTLHTYGKLSVCTECFVKLTLKPKGLGMRKYGTAEHVEKVGSKAVISDKKLRARDLEKVLGQPEKTAENSSPDKKPRKIKAIVTDADYRQED